MKLVQEICFKVRFFELASKLEVNLHLSELSQDSKSIKSFDKKWGFQVSRFIEENKSQSAEFSGFLKC